MLLSYKACAPFVSKKLMLKTVVIFIWLFEAKASRILTNIANLPMDCLGSSHKYDILFFSIMRVSYLDTVVFLIMSVGDLNHPCEFIFTVCPS
jgi:hypothetical protein